MSLNLIEICTIILHKATYSVPNYEMTCKNTKTIRKVCTQMTKSKQCSNEIYTKYANRKHNLNDNTNGNKITTSENG